jgi:hypothetical protein
MIAESAAYREHVEHELSAFRSEFEAAHAVALRDTDFRPDALAINAALDNGQHVVAEYALAYGPMDETLGHIEHFHSRHDTREQAAAEAERMNMLRACPELFFAVVEVAPEREPEVALVADEDIPF